MELTQRDTENTEGQEPEQQGEQAAKAHSPLPWFIEPRPDGWPVVACHHSWEYLGKTLQSSRVVAHAMSQEPDLDADTRAISQANAAYIITACNLYPHLVQSLRQATSCVASASEIIADTAGVPVETRTALQAQVASLEAFVALLDGGLGAGFSTPQQEVQT